MSKCAWIPYSLNKTEQKPCLSSRTEKSIWITLIAASALAALGLALSYYFGYTSQLEAVGAALAGATVISILALALRYLYKRSAQSPIQELKSPNMRESSDTKTISPASTIPPQPSEIPVEIKEETSVPSTLAPVVPQKKPDPDFYEMQRLPWILRQLHGHLVHLSKEHGNQKAEEERRKIEALLNLDSNILRKFEEDFRPVKMDPNYHVDESNMDSVLAALDLFLLEESEFRELPIDSFKEFSEDHPFFKALAFKGVLCGKTVRWAEDLPPIGLILLDIQDIETLFSQDENLKDLVPRIFHANDAFKKQNTERFNQLSSGSFNNILPYLKSKQRKGLDDAIVLRGDFAWEKVEDKLDEFFSENGTKRLQALGFAWVNRNIKKLSAWTLSQMPRLFLGNFTLDLEGLPNEVLNSMFGYSKPSREWDQSKQATFKEVRERIAEIKPDKINQISEKLDGRRLALLSRAQLLKLDVSQLTKEQVQEWFETAAALQNEVKCKDYYAHLCFNLGVSKINQMIDKIPDFSLLPPEFLRDKALRLEEVDSVLLNNMFGWHPPAERNWDDWSKSNSKNFEAACRRMALIHYSKVNQILDRLHGPTLALLSPDQLKELDIEQLRDEKSKVIEWFKTASALESRGYKDFSSTILAHLQVVGTNEIIRHLPNPSVIPDEFLEDSNLCLEEIDKTALNQMFSYPSLEESWHTYDLKNFERGRQRMAFVHPKKVNQLLKLNLLEGRNLVLLSDKQLENLNTGLLRNNAQVVREWFEAASKIAFRGGKKYLRYCSHVLTLLGVDKINPIIRHLPSLSDMPPAFLNNPDLCLERADTKALNNFFWFPSFDQSGYWDESDLKKLVSARKRMELIPLGKINDIASKLTGDKLAILSDSQLAQLDVKELDPSQIKEAIEAARNLENRAHQSGLREKIEKKLRSLNV